MPSITLSTTQQRTALTLLNTVLGELGMPSSNSVTDGEDTMVQLLYLANGLGSRLALLPFWAPLITTFPITTVDAQTDYDLPTDFGVPLSGTTWDRTAAWPLVGPVAPPQWQMLQSGLGTAGPQFRFRYAGLKLQVNPAPPANLTLVQEYLSRNWVLGVSGTVASISKPRITASDDYILLNEEMFITGVKAAWLQAKGLNSVAAVDEFKRMMEAAWGAVNSAAILSFSGGDAYPFLSWENIPDHGYGT